MFLFGSNSFAAEGAGPRQSTNIIDMRGVDSIPGTSCMKPHLREAARVVSRDFPAIVHSFSFDNQGKTLHDDAYQRMGHHQELIRRGGEFIETVRGHLKNAKKCQSGLAWKLTSKAEAGRVAEFIRLHQSYTLKMSTFVKMQKELLKGARSQWLTSGD